MNEFDKYLADHKAEAYALAEQNTVYDENGRAMIPKGDECETETEWDDLFQELKTTNKQSYDNFYGKQTNTATHTVT